MRLRSRTILAAAVAALALAAPPTVLLPVVGAPFAQARSSAALNEVCGAGEAGQDCGTNESGAICTRIGAQVICRYPGCTESSPCPSGRTCTDQSDSTGSSYRGCAPGGTGGSDSSAVLEEQQVNYTLGVDIPGFSFANIKVYEEGDAGSPNAATIVDIPWIADYIGAAYKWAVAAAAVVGAVMFMMGGFQYMTAGGDSGRVSAAKKRITDALVGLMLVLGAYLILGTISGQFTELKSLRIATVERDPYEALLGTTRADTTGGGSCGGSGALGEGSWTPTMTTCPVTLNTPDGGTARNAGAREQEFYAAIYAWGMQFGDPRIRIMKIAEAATKCEVRIGSCGNNVGTFYALAGFDQPPGTAGGCLVAGNCNGVQRRNKIWAADRGPLREILYGWRCDYRGGTVNAPRSFVRQGIVPAGTTYPRSNCVTSCAPARQQVLNFFRTNAGTLLPAGYPDSFLDQLQPGDAIDYYNGNSDLTSSHAVLFMGWQEGGKAQVISGSWGGFPRAHYTCLRSSCGESIAPVTGLYRVR